MLQPHDHAAGEARDKYTQIHWGIEDFRFRFGRAPEGMWLPETAVDLESLDIMAELGSSTRFCAASGAADSARSEMSWIDVSGGRIDPTRAYTCDTRPARTSLSSFTTGRSREPSRSKDC